MSDSLLVVLAAPILSSPSQSETLRTSTLNFDWNDVIGATQYQIQIHPKPISYLFTTPEKDNHDQNGLEFVKSVFDTDSI